MRDIRTGGNASSLHPGRTDRMIGNQRSIETGHSDPTYTGRSSARSFTNPFGLPQPVYTPVRAPTLPQRTVRLRVK